MMGAKGGGKYRKKDTFETHYFFCTNFYGTSNVEIFMD